MSELNCSAKLDANEGEILISSLAENVLVIDINSDVDFTELVKKLSEKIDEEVVIGLSIEDRESAIANPKNKPIIETLEDIFNSYNQSLHSANEYNNSSVDNEVPF